MKRIATNIISSLTLVLFLMLITVSTQAQISISSGFAPDIVVCQEAEKVELTIKVDVDISSALAINLELPPGVQYDSFEILNIPAEINMKEVNANLQSPRFRIEANTGERIEKGSLIVFAVSRTANCQAIDHVQTGGIFRDLIKISYTGGSDETFSTPYNVLFASLNVLPISNTAAYINDVVRREITIVNGGFGCTDSFVYNTQYNHNELRLEAIVLEGDTLEFERLTEGNVEVTVTDLIRRVGNKNACLDNDERLSFKEFYTNISCNLLREVSGIQNKVTWGCINRKCNDQKPVVSQVFLEAYVEPVVKVLYDDYQLPGSCTNGQSNILISNEPSEVWYEQGALFNVETLISWDGVNANYDFGVMSNFSINSQGINPLQNESEAFVISMLENTNPNLGFKDLDADGFYDDLDIGDEFLLSYEVDFPCLEDCRQGVESMRPQIELSYNNECQSKIVNQVHLEGEQNASF